MLTLIYAIGDIHGHLEKLKTCHAQILDDAKGRDHIVIHTGDLIDRGPDSAGVIRFLMDGQAAGHPWQVIKGNHDSFLVSFAHSGDPYKRMTPTPHISWLDPEPGGRATLESFGFELSVDLQEDLQNMARAIPRDMVNWLDLLPLMINNGNLLFVHAGINPERLLADQDPFDLMWIRKPFQDHTSEFGALVIHGHTPVKAVTHYGNRINIDTGAAYGQNIGMLVLEGMEKEMRSFALENGERRALFPPEGWNMIGRQLV